MARYIVTFADLVAIARRTGVKVVEAPSSHRGQHGEMGTVVGCTCHHTGTPNSYLPSSEYPDYNVVKEGRVGLENSLSAFGLGRYTTIYVFSEDISWHAGTWSFNGITDGNGHLLGIEAAGVGDWTPFQRAVYPRLVASILLFIGEKNPRLAAPRHLDGAMPRGRKTDAAHFEQDFLPGKDFYESVEWLMANPAYININYGGDDMPLSAADLLAIRTEVWRDSVFTHPVTQKKVMFGEAIRDTTLRIEQIAVDAAVARRLAEEAAKAGRALSEADVERIGAEVREAMAAVVKVEVSVEDSQPDA